MCSRAKKAAAPLSEVAPSDIGKMRAATIPSYLRLCFTPRGLVRLTTTEVQILAYLDQNAGRGCSKSQIAAAIGRNEKTVSRLISHLRDCRVLEVRPTYAENGAQLANVYQLALAEDACTYKADSGVSRGASDTETTTQAIDGAAGVAVGN